MAKELPYFKFEPAEYITKDISFCSYAAQGLFINLCSHYWQRNCEMTIAQAERRFKDKELLNELIDENIITHENGKIIIKFLILQRDEAIQKSNVNRLNGSKGGRPKKPRKTQNKPNGFNSQSETKGIRREEIIKEEIIDDGIYTNIDKLRDVYLKDERTIKAVLDNALKGKTKDEIDTLTEKFNTHLKSQGEHLKQKKDYASHFLNWAKKQKPEMKDRPNILK